MIMIRESKTDEVLTLLFMLLAIAAIICYFAVTERLVFLILGGFAVVLRLVQYALRYFK
jgi:membrane-bound ClpP family serine protease